MRSVPYAITWELVYRGFWPIILAMLGAYAFPVILLGALRMDGPLDPTDQWAARTYLSLQVIMSQIGMFTFAAALISTNTLSPRIYALPVTTWTLITWRLVPSILIVALQIALMTASLNWMFGLDWPIWGPMLFGAVAMAAMQAAIWYSEGSAILPLNVAGGGAILGIWFKSRYGWPFSMPTHSWTVVTASDLAVLTLFLVWSFALAHSGVSRTRRGDSLGILTWVDLLLMFRLEDIPSTSIARFQTRLQSQYWSEWRKKGWLLPGTVLFGMVIALSCWTLFSRQPKELLGAIVAGGPILSIIAMITGLIIGNLGASDSNTEIGQFLGTRPITNVELARTILKVSIRTILITWALWATVSAITIGIMAASGVDIAANLPRNIPWWYLPATLLGFWIAIGVVDSLALCGRATLLMKFFCTAVACGIAAPLIAKAFPREVQLWFLSAACVVGGIALAITTIWLVSRSHRQNLVGSSEITFIYGVWVMLAIIAIWECLRQQTPQIPQAILMVGLASLVGLPLASAPLAVTWNRHR